MIEGPRGYKERVDQHSKVACLPNSLAFESEPPIKKSKSCRVFRSYDVLNPQRKEHRNMMTHRNLLPQYNDKQFVIHASKPRPYD